MEPTMILSYLIIFGIFYQMASSYKMGNFINENTHLRNIKEIENIDMKRTIIYCEDWSCGEVEWEFAKGDMQKIYSLIVIPSNENDIEKKIPKFNLNNLTNLSEEIIKILYNDVVNLESVISELQNINYINSY